MFKKTVISALCFFSPLSAGIQEELTPSQNWFHNEQEAMQRVHEEHLPLVIAFLGEGWCPWSEKLAGEMLGRPAFFEALQNKAVLLRIAMTQEASSPVREKYQVYHCPQVIVYAEDGEEIGRLGYAPLADVQYAEQITALITQFHTVKEFLKNPVNNAHLEPLYREAKKFSSPVYKEKLLQLGVERTKDSFFLLEKYASLLKQFKFKNPLVQETRRKVLALDPHNAQGTIAKLAVLEFQKFAHTFRKKEHPEKAVAPLLAYVKQFGAKDRENLWKIEMMVAQYLFSKNFPEVALHHAQAAHSAAPEEAKPEVTALIDYFKTTLER